MFDKRTHSVLNYLESQCPSGTFKVLDKKDVVDAMPAKYGVTLVNLDSIIEFLEQNEYLVSKYLDEEQMCITITPKAHSALLHNTKFVEKPKFDKKIYWIIGFVAFFGALIGSIAGKFLGF